MTTPTKPKSKSTKPAAKAAAPSAPKQSRKKAAAAAQEVSMSATGTTQGGISGVFREVSIDALQIWSGNAREQVDREGLEELTQSIRDQGLLQPPVTRNVNGTLEVIAGQRRTLALRALQAEGVIDRVAVLDIGEVDDSRALVISLIENIKRENIRPSDEARTVGKLYGVQGMTLRQIASELGRSETTVKRLARISSLDDSNMTLLDDGQITSGQAELLAEAEPKMRRQVLKWLKEGTDLDTARTMLTSRAARFDLKDALFTQEAYEAAAPGKLETDLFGTTSATDRATFIQLQQDALQAQLDSGMHGDADETRVHISAELPSELGLQEDAGGAVLVGLINPLNGTTRVVRASAAVAVSEQSMDLSATLRAGVMAKLRGVLAREALTSKPDVAREVLPALLLMQLEGGPRSFVISRQASEVGLDTLGTAHPARGMYGDLVDLLHSGKSVDLSGRLTELYEGSPETDAIVLAAAKITRAALNAARLRSFSAEEIAILVPGAVRGTHEETVAQVDGTPIDVSEPLMRSARWGEETVARIEAAGLQGQYPYEQVRQAVADGRHSDAIDLMTVAAQEGLSRAELQAHTQTVFSEDEILDAYDSLDAAQPGVADFRAAVDREDMTAASRLLGQLRSAQA